MSKIWRVQCKCFQLRYIQIHCFSFLVQTKHQKANKKEKKIKRFKSICTLFFFVLVTNRNFYEPNYFEISFYDLYYLRTFALFAQNLVPKKMKKRKEKWKEIGYANKIHP